MARRTSYGKCFLCGKRISKQGATRHLKSCRAKQPSSSRGKTGRLFQIAVSGKDAPDYWMHLEVAASATLRDLDTFLRDIWLECCGHLSEFLIGGVRYDLNPQEASMWSPEPVRSMDVRLEGILEVGSHLAYTYDFGSSTELTLRVVDDYKGRLPRGKIRVLARNYSPVYTCAECDKPAKWAYMYEWPPLLYCDEHAETLDDDEGMLPLVNSPRAGECGYTGPYQEELLFEETDPEAASAN